MPKTGISVTLDERNLLWLRARTLASKARSVSETLDELVTAARNARGTPLAAIRSVVGTIDLPLDDPGLEKADSYVRELLRQTIDANRHAVKTTRPRGGVSPRTRTRPRRG